MFSIRSKLATLLQPWLQAEPDLELKLGFLRSHGSAKNLCFNISALNQLIDESSCVCFKDVRIEKLNVRFSSWSAPAFTVEVRGFYVTLTVRELMDERSPRKMRSLIDRSVKEMKEILSVIDPEGTALHDVIESFSAVTPARNWRAISLWNVLLKHCRLQLHDIHLEVQFPVMNDSLACTLKIKELSVEALQPWNTCLLKGLVRAFFASQSECSLVLKGTDLEIGLKRGEYNNIVFSSSGIVTCIKLKDLQLIDLDGCSPQLNFTFSPVDLPILLAFDMLSSKEVKCPRNGGELWKIAARRVGYLSSNPRLSLHKVVDVVVLWLRHVHAYESLLLLVGYSIETIFKQSAIRMSLDKKFSARVKHQWKVVSDIEKELPVDALARARRIARYRASMHVQYTNSESRIEVLRKFIRMILSLLLFLLKTTFCMFQSVIRFFFMGGILNHHLEVDGLLGVVSEDSCFRYCFNFGKICITVSPTNAVHRPVNGRSSLHIGSSHLKLLSFSVVVDGFLLIYMADNTVKSLSLSCGGLKVNSYSSMSSLTERNMRKETRLSFKGSRKESINELKTVVWSEPAPQSVTLEKVESGSASSSGNAWFLHLNGYLEEMWSNWKRICKKFEGREPQYLENPFLLCEIKSFLMDPCFHRPDYGLWKCSLSMGKLYFDLGTSSIMSVSLLFKQMQHSFCWTARSGRTGIPSRSSSIIEEPKEIKWEDCYKSYEGRMKMAMLRMLPEKNIQIGLAIAGINIRMSLQEAGFFDEGEQEVNHIVTPGHGDFYIAFDLESVELTIWPNSKGNLSTFTVEPRLDEAGMGYLSLKEPQFLDILKADSSENCISQGRFGLNYCLIIKGLNAYVEDLEEKHQWQFIILKTVTIHSSSCREYLHSLVKTVTALSMSLCGMVTGVSVLSYMDELWVFFQVIECILRAVSYSFASFDSTSGLHFQEIIWNKRDTDGFKQASEAKGSALILKSTLFVIDARFEFSSLDIIMHSSRKNNVVENFLKAYDASRNKKLTTLDVPEYGIQVSVAKPHIQISWEEGHVKVLIDLPGIQSGIFQCQNQIGECADEHQINNLLHQSPNCLYELSLSNFSFTLWAGSYGDALFSGRVNGAVGTSTSGSKTSSSVEGHLTFLSEGSNVPSCGSNQKSGQNQLITSNLLAPSSSYQFLIDIALGEIFMAECSLKNVLIGAHQPKKLLSLLSIGREFRTISWTTQGGLVFFQTSAFAMFVRCFSMYLMFTTNLFSTMPSWEHISPGRQSEIVEPGEEMARPSNHTGDCAQGTVSSLSLPEACSTSPESKWELLETLMIRLSQVSLVLINTDGSGRVWELMLEADFHLKLELINLRRKLLFDLSRLTILSRRLHESCSEQTTKEIQTPRFSSVTFNDLPSHSVPADPTAFQYMKSMPQVFYGACSSSSPVPEQESVVGNDVSGIFGLNHGNYILKHVAASILVEKAVRGDGVGHPWFRSDWVGSGSVSGFDLTISLSEIQMLIDLFAPLSGVLSRETTDSSKQRHWSGNHGWDNDSEDMVPDEAIVAIQDLHQHVYFAVEGVENKYCLTGAMHYSLVGEKALFKVKYCNRKTWGLPVSWFTLISLHAKSSSGEPLRLNYRPGSGFVDISSTDDSAWALWRTLSCKPESYEADNDVESYSLASKNTFYLVNKKCNHAVAFIDGVPELVKKPGNPFKVKLFNGFSLARDVSRLDTPSGRTYETDLQQATHMDEDQSSRQACNLPYVNIDIDKVTFTIVHELPDASDKFPLLRVCIDDVQFIVQVLSSKTRLISTFTVVIFYFDAQRNLWREIVHPVDMYLFYRSKCASQGSEIIPQGVPVHFYFRIKQVDVSLTELSLDILLFMVGEVNLAGPYAVRSSMIFANCCKVENRTGLSLLCHFYDNQDAAIAGKQSALIFLRRFTLANRLPENSSFVSVRLAALGAFSTSPVHISLLDARVLAWRTRAVSLRDSRTYPGPFVVVDISKKTQDGLSIVVSPLLRIHNETGFSMEIRFQRPQQEEVESASVLLRTGDTIDDSVAAFDAITLHGGSKKALMSLSLGNFLFSFRPVITENFQNSGKPISMEWSEDLKGEKAVRLSGIFDKLNYRFRRAFGVESLKYSFSTIHCSLNVDGAHATDLHFLIQTIGRGVPVVKPDNFRDTSETRTSPVAIQEQKEIFLLPTVQFFNLVQSEIHVLLTETHPDFCTTERDNTGKEATIPCGSSAYLYGNPAVIYFTVTLNAFNSRCKPVNSGDWVKKLHKQKHDVHSFDIDLDFDGGKYHASLRLSRGDRGMLEAAVFTQYTFQNDSDLPLFCFASNQKPLFRPEADQFGSSLPPDIGLLLPPKSTRSWFPKSNRVHLKLLEERASLALLDLDVLSGFTEVCLEVCEEAGVKHISKLGVSLKPFHSKVAVSSQIVLIVPRYVISNESQEAIFARQYYLEGDMDDFIAVNSKQKIALLVKTGTSRRGEINFFDSLLRKHRNANTESSIFIQFRLNEIGWSWSGPICVASLGRFFLKFTRPVDSLGHQPNLLIGQGNKITEFAVVHVVEEGSALVLHFYRPPNISLPYRIENLLSGTSITYYQKDSLEPDTLGSGNSTNYVWDDLTLPHKLVVQITGMHLSREINMDKVCSWKPLFKVRQHRGLVLDLPLEKKPGDHRRSKDESHDLEMLKVGYEVYADGPTRVLHISEFPGRCKESTFFLPCAKIQLKIPYFAIHLLEIGKQDEDTSEPSIYSPIMVARFGNIHLDSMFTDQSNCNQIRIQSLNVDEKWVGAPFAAMLRRNQLDYTDTDGDVLQIIFILLSTNSNVKQVQYSSIVLQPVVLNLDEETLMRLVRFWRTSLSDSNAPSRQFYFKQFEIHPIKIEASFLPGSSDSNYSSAQETLRSLLHSVIKIPAVKNMDVELNGILVTHALVTMRELLVKCAKHYSWYAMRTVYIAKGSSLLPPAFASIFDDSASSALDVFFDPSSGLINLPGLTLGMFKFISKCIDKKGFSGTKRYFGDLGKTVKTAGSNVLFAAITEISDCVLKGAEANGFNGMVNGFHQGILKLAMEPSLLGTAVMEGGPDRKIKLDRSPGVDELYIEGYLQAMLDTMYKQEYLRVRVIDNQVILKNLPPNSSLINEITDQVRSFLIGKTLLKGESSATSRPLGHLRGENEWKIVPTMLTLWEHLFVSFAIRMLRKQAFKFISGIKWKEKSEGNDDKAIVPASTEKQKVKLNIKWGIRKFVFSGIVAYIDGRLCRSIPNAIVRRIVSGFLLSLLDKNDGE